LLHWIALYIIIALGYVVILHIWKGPMFIRTGSKHFPWKLNYSFRWWRAHEWWGASVVFTLVILIIMLAWQILGGSLNISFARTMLTLVCLTSTVYSIKHHSLVKKFKDHSWWLTLITAAITIVLAIAANAFSDSYILNSTRTDPSKFPIAQKSISTTILITLWFYIATLILSILALSNSFWDAITTRPTVFPCDKSLGINTNKKNYKPGAAHRRSEYAKIIAAIGSAFTIAILLAIGGTISDHYTSILQETLIFSSFHLHPKDCGIRGLPAESWLTPIGDGEAILAIPGKNEYQLQKVRCTILSQEELQKDILDKISKDNYW